MERFYKDLCEVLIICCDLVTIVECLSNYSRGSVIILDFPRFAELQCIYLITVVVYSRPRSHNRIVFPNCISYPRTKPKVSIVGNGWEVWRTYITTPITTTDRLRITHCMKHDMFIDMILGIGSRPRVLRFEMMSCLSWKEKIVGELGRGCLCCVVYVSYTWNSR